MASPLRSRVGRPRLAPDTSDLPAREQILDAAAALFVQHGFAATTTRGIADRVGMRQSSLYYHFAGKDDMLLELLERTVRPSLDYLGTLERTLPSATAVYLLALRDIETLAAAPHNVGSLYLLPEAAQPRYESFRADRAALRDAYGQLGWSAATADVRDSCTPSQLGALLIHQVEIVISARRDGDGDGVEPSQIAAACLRLCGLPPVEVAAVSAELSAR